MLFTERLEKTDSENSTGTLVKQEIMEIRKLLFECSHLQLISKKLKITKDFPKTDKFTEPLV